MTALISMASIYSVVFTIGGMELFFLNLMLTRAWNCRHTESHSGDDRRDSERLCHFPKVACVVSSRAGIRKQSG